MTVAAARPQSEPQSTPHHHQSRAERVREALEFWLDGVLRPAAWAAAVSYRLGLQGQLHLHETTIRSTAPRATPLRIAFASDFHAGPTTDRRTLEHACEILAALRPDVLLLGGDFVSVRAGDITALAPLIAAIDAPLGKFGVLGNHDIRTDWQHVVRELERADVRILTNECVALDAPFDDVAICGVDDPSCGEPRPDLAIDGVDGMRIVLMHSPETLASIGDRPFDLALCGHTHGGQIATPWGTPLFVPGGPLNRQFCRGEFALDGPAPRTLLVTSGVGCSAFPARLFAAPEIHLCLIT